MANNDERILKLRESIAAKKEELKKNGVTRFNPTTDCLIPTDFVGKEFVNINTLGKNDLILLGAHLVAVADGCTKFGFDAADIPLHGRCYTILDYISDIGQKLEYMRNAEAKRELDAAEKKLGALLSDDKKTELAIDDIAKALGI